MVSFAKNYLAHLKKIICSAVVDEKTSNLSLADKQVSRLFPTQQWWFDELNYQHKDYDPVDILLIPKKHIELKYFKKSVLAVLNHYPVFRLRFHRIAGNRWIQFIDEKASFDVPVYKIKKNCEHHFKDTCLMIKKSMRIESGLCACPAIFISAAWERPRLYLAIHHLLIDGFSWDILVQKIATTYHNLIRKQPVQLLPESISYFSLINKLEHSVCTNKIQKQWDYWRDVVKGKYSFPVDHEKGRSKNKHFLTQQIIWHNIEPDALLRVIPATHNLFAISFFIAAIALVVLQWKEQKKLQIHIVSHNRDLDIDNLDISTTIGWLASFYPLKIDMANLKNDLTLHSDSLLDFVKNIDANIKQVPNGGVAYNLLKYFDSENADRQTLNNSINATFNYSTEGGGCDLFEITNEGLGVSDHSENSRLFPMEFYAVCNESVNMTIRYSTRHYKKQTINYIANLIRSNFEMLVNVSNCQ